MATVNEITKLIIRTTNNKYVDFSIEISTSVTIYDLKQKITLVPENQRLIYSGKLLDDKNLLHQVFTKTASSSTHIVHLVLDSDKNEPLSNILSSRLHSSDYIQYMNQLTKYQQQLQHQNHQIRQRIIPTIIENQSTTVPLVPARNDNPLRSVQFIVYICILCLMICFCTTISHFFVIFGFYILLFLFYRGYRTAEEHRRAQNHQTPPVDNDFHQENETEPNINEQLNADDASPQEYKCHITGLLSSSSTSTSVTNNEITSTRLLFQTISNFFLSLIPDGAQHV
ncbi:hypothetical protein I4U23_018956 [Adineta vaga]|nr:hypothetical protein I4U23_018956 [Adineta vaga]